MKSLNSFKIILAGLLIILLTPDLSAQNQKEILKYWAPEVYHDVNSSKSPWIIGNRQYYTARDIPVEIDFDENEPDDTDDNPLYVGNNWDNSHFQVWEQEKINDRMTPALNAAAYVSFVESEKFYFLGYGFYHAGDDSNIGADRHEHDWEMVMLVIKKDGSKYGSFQGMLTQRHREHLEYKKSEIPHWNGSHPKIYISANGTFDPTEIYGHGHGIEVFTNRGYQDDHGSDAIILQAGDYGQNVTNVDIPGDNKFNNARKYSYKLVSMNELWACRGNNSVYRSYTGFRGGSSVNDGGNTPWEREYFKNPIADFKNRDKFNFLDAELNKDSYIFNPYFGNVNGQKLNDNPNEILPKTEGWGEADLGNGKGKTYSHRETFVIDGLGSNFGGNADHGYFLYKKVKGDCEIVAAIDQLQSVYHYTKGGLMIRESLNKNSKNVFAHVLSDMTFRTQKRSKTNGGVSVTKTESPSTNGQVYVKIKRTGNNIKTYYSSNKTDFIEVTSDNIDMNETIFVGMAVSSSSSSDYASSMFYDVSIKGELAPLTYAPKAVFEASATSITKGKQVEFTDLSTHNPTSWTWIFNGGTPSRSTEQNPTVTYDSEGVYDVKLIVKNTDGSSEIAKKGFITVSAKGAVAWFYKDCNKQNYAGSLGVGEYTLNDLRERGISNDDISSITLTSGYKVTIYEHHNFTGYSTTITSNEDCLVHNSNGRNEGNWNDDLSSVKVEHYLSSGHVYNIKSAHSGKYLEVKDASSDNGANVMQWYNTGNDNQKWLLEKVDGAFYLKAKHSGKCLDVAGNSTSDGGNIQQWDCHGENNQKWRIIDAGSGQYKLESVHSGKVLDVAGKSNSNGGNIQQWSWSGASNQKWIFTDFGLEKAAEKKSAKAFESVTQDLTFKVYPNPVTDFITIEVPSEETSKVAMFDSQGKLVQIRTFNARTTIQTSEICEPGVYYIKVSFGKKVNTQKIIVK